MRITIEIEEKHLNRIQKITGEKKKSPAVTRALTDYLRRLDRDEFIKKVLSGKTDFSAKNEELERRNVYETR